MNFRRTRCPQCKGKLEAGQRIHPECIDAYAESEAAKAQRKADKQARALAKLDRALVRERKAALKTNGEHKAEAQRVRNQLVLALQAHRGCISCGAMTGQFQAGHYRSRGSAPHLALDLRNINKQCVRCNLHLHGNPIGYRAGLVEIHGEGYVLELEADQSPRDYRATDYSEMKKQDRARLRELKRQEA